MPFAQHRYIFISRKLVRLGLEWENRKKFLFGSPDNFMWLTLWE